MSHYHRTTYAKGYDQRDELERELRALSIQHPASSDIGEPFDDEEEHYDEYPDNSASFQNHFGYDRRPNLSESSSGTTRNGNSRSYTAPAELSYQDECVARIEREIANAPAETDRIKPAKDGAWIKVDGMGWHLLKWEYLYVWLMDRDNTASLPKDDIVRQTSEFLRARATPDGWRNYEYHKRRQQLAEAAQRQQTRDLGDAIGQDFIPQRSYPSELGDSGYGSLPNSEYMSKSTYRTAEDWRAARR